MKVMVSGYFDPLHYGHYLYLKEAAKLGMLYCVVASDKQVELKKGAVNETEEERCKMLDLVLTGAKISHIIFVNRWDKDKTVREAIKVIRPDIFCRGADKDEDDFPEKCACQEVGAEVRYIKTEKILHGSLFV